MPPSVKGSILQFDARMTQTVLTQLDVTLRQFRVRLLEFSHITH